MMPVVIKILFLLVLVASTASCGSSSRDPASDSVIPVDTGNAGSSTGNNPQFRTEVIINKQLRMTIEQGDTNALPDFFPAVAQEFMHYFAYNGVFYLYTDQFREWRYFGKSSITEIFEGGETGELSDNFKITTSLSEYSLSYTTFYNMDGPDTGTWHAEIAGEQFSGRFTYERSHQQGENPINPRDMEQGQITSSITGITYDYYAFFPKDYAEHNKDYPLLLATDGQWHRYPFYDLMSSMKPQVFLVALSQGPTDRRRVDFVLPGVDDYAQFLELELLPFLESRFRLKAENRTLVGSSLGGLMVSSMLYKEMERVNIGQPRIFTNFISLDGAYRHDTALYNQQADEVFSSALPLSGKLYLAGASEGLGFYVERYYQSMVARNIPELAIAHETFPFGHVPMKLPSMEHALDFVYPE